MAAVLVGWLALAAGRMALAALAVRTPPSVDLVEVVRARRLLHGALLSAAVLVALWVPLRRLLWLVQQVLMTLHQLWPLLVLLLPMGWALARFLGWEAVEGLPGGVVGLVASGPGQTTAYKTVPKLH